MLVDFSFSEINLFVSLSISDDFPFIPLNEALKKIRSSGKSCFLYFYLISLERIVIIFPFLSKTWIDNNISLNSLPKQPAFILIPPPIVPGIQDKNSNPLKLFCIAKLDNCLSKTELPAIIMSSFKRDKLLKFLDNFITTPSNRLSLIKVFEPAPSINIFFIILIFLKN